MIKCLCLPTVFTSAHVFGIGLDRIKGSETRWDQEKRRWGGTRRLGQLVSSYRSSLAHSVELRVWIVVVQSHWDLISAEEMQSGDRHVQLEFGDCWSSRVGVVGTG